MKKRESLLPPVGEGVNGTAVTYFGEPQGKLFK
jgi:hypothetical protein